MITASPRDAVGAEADARSASAACRRSGRADAADQSTRKPQLAGRNGATAPGRSRPAGVGAKPRPGRAAERQDGDVAGRIGRPAVSKRSAPSASQPVQRCRACSRTPRSPSRRSQARSSGEAFIAAGNTRPLVPTKVGWPRPWHHAISASGGNARMIGSSQSRARRRSATGRHRQAVRHGSGSAAAPRHQQLAAGRGHVVVDCDTQAGAGQGLSCDQAGGASADDGGGAGHAGSSSARTRWESCLKGRRVAVSLSVCMQPRLPETTLKRAAFAPISAFPSIRSSPDPGGSGWATFRRMAGSKRMRLLAGHGHPSAQRQACGDDRAWAGAESAGFGDSGAENNSTPQYWFDGHSRPNSDIRMHLGRSRYPSFGNTGWRRHFATKMALIAAVPAPIATLRALAMQGALPDRRRS